jgi:hypothetical protein
MVLIPADSPPHQIDEARLKRRCPVRLRRITPAEPVLVGQRWKFEQERVVSLVPEVEPHPSRSSHLVLEAVMDESRPALPGVGLVLGIAAQVCVCVCVCVSGCI